MFEQSLVESTHKVGTRKPTTMMVSLAIQVIVVAVMAIVPLIYYQLLPASSMTAFLSAPPPPPPPMPKIVVHHIMSEVNTNNQIIAPRTIPKGIERVVETAPPPPVNIANTSSVGDAIGSLISNAPPPPPPPPPPPAPIKVGGSVQEAMCIACPKPSYPPIAKAAHIQGDVVLHAIIAADGTIKSLDVVSGNQLLVGEARRVVSQWRYHPMVLDGTAQEVDTTITVKFSLGG